MAWENSCVAICNNHLQAEAALHLLQKKGFDANTLSIVGNDYPYEKYPLAALEGVVTLEGLSTLGVALYRIAIPEDSIIRYETLIRAGCYLLVTYGNQNEVERACDVLAGEGVREITVHLR